MSNYNPLHLNYGTPEQLATIPLNDKEKRTGWKGISADAFEDGEETERERIIKLLENYQGLTGMFGLERDDLIALIKGEK